MSDPLLAAGQEHLAPHRDRLAKQLESIDLHKLKLQQSLLKRPQEHASDFQPFTHFDERNADKSRATGEQLLHQGGAGCIVVAGGQGSRLGFDGPKGCFPIFPESGTTLFHLLAEKVKAASTLYGACLPIAIMTSPANHEQTVRFFEENGSFGLVKGQVAFFQQGELPLLDEEGRLFLEDEARLAMGADGNGEALHHFVRSGLAERWKNQGVSVVQFQPVDNLLAEPFDPVLIGHHLNERDEVTVKCVKREDPQEKVGVLVQGKGGVQVVEYSELSQEQKLARSQEGTLKFPCANISLFAFSMGFIEKISTIELPLHRAHKAVTYLDETGKSVKATEPMSWKFETFIFDVLASADHVSALLYPREECFAPLKNKEGPYGPEGVRKALRTV